MEKQNTAIVRIVVTFSLLLQHEFGQVVGMEAIKCVFGTYITEGNSCLEIEMEGGCADQYVCVQRKVVDENMTSTWAGCCPAGKGPCETLTQMLDPNMPNTNMPVCNSLGFFEPRQCNPLGCVCITREGKSAFMGSFHRPTEVSKVQCRAEPSELCLDCMCGVQSGDRSPGCGSNRWMDGDDRCPENCVMDRRKCRCGPYLITEEQFNNCSTTTELPINTWPDCAADNNCARKCLKEFMAKNVLSCAKRATPEEVDCEDFARMLYGGAAKCKSPKTKFFGRRVNRCVKNHKRKV